MPATRARSSARPVPLSSEHSVRRIGPPVAGGPGGLPVDHRARGCKGLDRKQARDQSVCRCRCREEGQGELRVKRHQRESMINWARLCRLLRGYLVKDDCVLDKGVMLT